MKTLAEIERIVLNVYRRTPHSALDPTMFDYGVYADTYGRHYRRDRSCGMCVMGAYMWGKVWKTGFVPTDFAKRFGRSQDWGDGVSDGTTEYHLPCQLVGTSKEVRDYKAGYRFGMRLAKKARKIYEAADGT